MSLDKSDSTESEDENLDFLKEATDNVFFKNSLYNNKEENIVEEKTVEAIPSLRRKDEYDQFRILNVTPEFQKFVSNALSKKLEKYLSENMVEYKDEKKKRKKSFNSIKLLNSSKCAIEVENYEVENPEKVIKRIKKETTKTTISESDLKSIVITGEEILKQKGTEHWSQRSKASLFRYHKDDKGVLNLIEPEFK